MSGNKTNTPDLSLVLQQLSSAIASMSKSQDSGKQDSKLTETFVFGQVSKYDGNNVKAWINTVRSAFEACGKGDYLKREISPQEPEYIEYCRYYGLIIFTFNPNTIELVQHCKTVFQVWSYMIRFEKDTFATSVRKFTTLLKTTYNGGTLRKWSELLTARFEDLESEWVSLNESTRCVLIISLLPRPSFDRLADRLTSRDKITMKDIINAFVEEDEKNKSSSLSTKRQDSESIIKQAAKAAVQKKSFHKSSKPSSSNRSELKCTYCHRNGHSVDQCHTKFWDDGHKSKNVPQTNRPGTSATNTNTNSANRQARSVVLKCTNRLPNGNSWIIDSGCTSHATNDDSNLIHPVQKSAVFEAAGGSPIISEKMGGTIINLNNGHKLQLSNVAFGNFNSNLLSVQKLFEDGYSIIFDGESENPTVTIRKGDFVTEASRNDDGLWVLINQPVHKMFNLWHHRLGHPGKTILDRVHFNHPEVDNKLGNCHECCQNKSIASSHKLPMIYKDVGVFEFLHIDLWESPTLSVSGCKYGMLIVDHFSRFCFGIPLKSKSDAAEAIIDFINYRQRRHKRVVRFIRTDCGREFVNSTLDDFCLENGIEHETTVGYAPEQNGIVERMNRTVFGTVRTLLNSANVPHYYWAETMITAICLINIWIRDDGLSPYEKFFDKKPTYNHLRTFGCVAYGHIPKGKRVTKLDPTSKRLLFLGYTKSPAMYRLLDPTDHEVYIMHDVKFVENEMYFSSDSTNQSSYHHSSDSSSSTGESLSSALVHFNSITSDNETNTSTQQSDNILDSSDNNDISVLPSTSSQSSFFPSSSSTSIMSPSSSPSSSSTLIDQHDSDYNPDDDFSDTRSSLSFDNDEQPVQRQLSRENRGVPPIRFGFKCVNSHVIPATYAEALGMPDADKWREAIHAEIDQLQKYKVFAKVPHDDSIRPIPTKWIFTRKRTGKYKARLVACGYRQQLGVDYNDTASPTPDRSLTNIVLSWAKTCRYKVRQLDVRTAFLNAPLDEPVYVRPPPGFGGSGLLKLEKALYGLKQSPLQWYRTIANHLQSIGFVRCTTDRCLFKRNDTILLLYVDDIIVTGKSESDIDSLIDELDIKFEITDLGNVNDYLGISIVEFHDRFELSQSKYISKVLEEFNMTNCHSAKVPMSSLYEYDDNEPVDNSLPVQKLIGCLLYIANRTRPDICFAVNWLSRYMSKPTGSLFKACKQILRYLAGTIDSTLVCGELSCDLELYTDSSFGQGTTRHSTSGIFVKCGNSSLFWRSMKQRKISVSSCEAESKALLDGYKTIIPILEIFEFIGFHVFLKFKCDNQSTIHIFKGGQMKKSRSFDIEIKKLVEIFEQTKYTIEYVETAWQLADMLTKPLSFVSFKNLLNHFNIMTNV